MKKVSTTLSLVVGLLLLFTVKASALSLIGMVTPVLNPDNKTGTLFVNFSFGGPPNTAELNVFQFDLPDETFISLFGFSSISGPAGWTPTGILPNFFGDGNWIIGYTGILPANSSFSFSFEFELLVPTTDPSFASIWPAGNAPWGLNFGSTGIDGIGGGPFGGVISPGGSTHTPEPATLLLLGGGLVAAGAARRLRAKKNRK